MRQNDLKFIGAAAVIVGLILVSDPRCKAGCRSIAQHLIAHSLKDFFGELGA